MTSYVNREQFTTLFDSISDINKKITGHSEQIDELETKLLELHRRRRERKKR